MDNADLDRRFDYHRPSGAAQEYHQSIRAAAKQFARDVLSNLPAGRESALALTKFEEATFWAHAAVAREPGLHEEASNG